MKAEHAAASEPVHKHFHLLWRAAVLTLVALTMPAAAAQGAAAALAEKMLDRLGGRSGWAALRNTINGSQQNRATEPTVLYAVVTVDFERPRFRIEMTAPDLHLIRVVNGDANWRLNRAGAIEDLPAERAAEDIAWYGAHIYRTIHRLAAADDALNVGIAADGRLEVFEDGKRLIWFRLDARGEPYAFGFRGDETGSLSGPWDVVKDGIHHPRWVSNADGTWRVALKAVQFNVPLHDSVFARPATDASARKSAP